MDKEIEQFIDAVGAKAPEPADAIYEAFKTLFKRPNYFLLNGTILIVKISRTSRPFWGVGKETIERVNNFENYYLVLLESEKEGRVFSKADVNLKINSGDWKLGHDNQYKINLPLQERFSFSSPSTFLTKLRFD